MVLPEAVFFALTLPFCFYTAWSDLSSMRIANKLNIALFAVFLLSGLILLPFGDYASRIGIAAAALVVGFLLNATGQMGGGDAKFIAAAIPFVDPGDLGVAAFILSACLLAAVVTHRVARAIPAVRNLTPGWKSWMAKKFPMGLGLAVGLSLYLLVRGFGLDLPGVAT